MILNRAFRSAIIAFAFVSGMAAVCFLIYIVFSLIFQNSQVFLTLFGVVWIVEACLFYYREDRAKILETLGRLVREKYQGKGLPYE